MNHVEDDLKAALRRKPAPPGFAAKVLERIESEAVRKKAPRGFSRNPVWLAAAASVILAVTGTGIYRHHIHTRNEAALERTLAALSIAAAQLDEVEKKAFETERWERIGRQLNEVQSTGHR